MGFLYRKFHGRPETELEDIGRNLRYILSAKRGVSEYFPDFGLSEPTHSSLEEAMIRYAEEVRSTVERYEPRVRILEMEEDRSSDRPSLIVQLALRRTGGQLTLQIDPKSRSLEWVSDP